MMNNHQTLSILFVDFLYVLECNFMAGFTKETEHMGVPKMELAVAFTPPPRTELFVSKSEDWEIHIFITAVSSSLEGKDPRVKVMNDFENAKCLIQKDYLTFWKSHENDWNDIWKSGTIKVDGNLQLAQAVNSSMYYIIRYNKNLVNLNFFSENLHYVSFNI